MTRQFVSVVGQHWLGVETYLGRRGKNKIQINTGAYVFIVPSYSTQQLYFSLFRVPNEHLRLSLCVLELLVDLLQAYYS